MTDVIASTVFRQCQRIYSIQIITESGIYKEDELPDSEEGSAQLTVEVIHEVLMADKAGRTQRLVFAIPEALDKDGKTGGGYTLDGTAYESQDYPPDSGGGATVPTKLYTSGDCNITTDNKKRAETITNLNGGWPPPSSGWVP